jgi:hypothetical protein
MNTAGPEQFDLVDFLLALGAFAAFVIFGICMWVIRREMNKKNPIKETG